MAQQVLEGTWEEIIRQASRLTGRRVRVTVLDAGTDVGDAPVTLSRMERASAFRTWAESHRRDTPLLSDEAISRESIYFDDDRS